MTRAPSSSFVPTVGTARRLQALAAIGWGLPELSRRLGVGWERVSQYRRSQHPHVWRSTAEKVAALYAELEMIPGPSTITRRYAQRQGWSAPLAWDGDIDDPDARPVDAPADDKADENIVEVFLRAHRCGDPLPLWSQLTKADREALCVGLAGREYETPKGDFRPYAAGTVERLTHANRHAVRAVWNRVVS